jgi:predicted CopG family antitoxin
MMKTIEITESVYDRLATKITGFGDTPSLVIERLLNDVDGAIVKPTLAFFPEDESEFKELLLRNKVAEVALYKKNGEIDVLVWNASKLKESSNIKANIWSGYLRNWEDKGIIKAGFTIYESSENCSKTLEELDICKRESPIVNIPYNTLIQFDFEPPRIEEIDGNKMRVIQFSNGQDFELLENNKFFNTSTKRIEIYEHEVNYPF